MITRKQSGFTIVEIMITLLIISIVAAIAFPSYQSYVQRAEIGQAEVDLQDIALLVTRFQIASGAYPDALADVGWTKVDPWGNDYRYLKIMGAAASVRGQTRKDRNLVPINADFDLYSVGPDGASLPPLTAAKSRDDIIRADNGAFYGLAEDY